MKNPREKVRRKFSKKSNNSSHTKYNRHGRTSFILTWVVPQPTDKTKVLYKCMSSCISTDFLRQAGTTGYSLSISHLIAWENSITV